MLKQLKSISSVAANQWPSTATSTASIKPVLAQEMRLRAMHELDIQIICANTPQAKGRVERTNQTLQGRLPKEMRLLNIRSREDGNAYLPELMADFNQRFADDPRSQVDAHRLLTRKDDLARILTWQVTRTISKNLLVQFENVVYQIQTERPTYAMRNAIVAVCVDAKQNVTLLYKGKSLPYTIFHKQAKQSEVIIAKDLNTVIEAVSFKPAPDHPWRTFNLSKNKSRNVPFGGRENGDNYKDDHKRNKRTGSNATVIKETGETKRSGRNVASEYGANQTIVATLHKIWCSGFGLKTSWTQKHVQPQSVGDNSGKW
jgi:hypothetical protein